MSQDSAPEGSPPATTSENDSSLTEIGSQFDSIPDECYTRDIKTDIPVEDEQQVYTSVPVGWDRESK